MNEIDGNRKNADFAYILFGAYTDGDEVRIARVIVNHYNDGVPSRHGYRLSIDDVVYGASIKKKRAWH